MAAVTRGRLAPALALFGLVAQSCVLGAVDYSEKPCPCARGYTCDDARNRCVRDGDDGGAALDAGSAMADAGLDASPGIDAHVDDPTTACDDLLSDALFCESFEDGSLLHWTVREAYDGTVAHSRARAFRGLGSLAARTSAPAGYAERIATVLDSIESGDVYVRAYVYIEAGAPLVHSSILHIGGHRARTATEPLAGFNVLDGFASMYIGAGGGRVDARLVEVPRDEWFCMQFHLHIDDVAGSAEIWIDETPAGALADIDTRTDSPYVSFGAGIAWSTLTQEPFAVAIDEVAIGRTPMPCE